MHHWQKLLAGIIVGVFYPSICLTSEVKQQIYYMPSKESLIAFDNFHKKIPLDQKHIIPPQPDEGVRIDGLATDICVNYIWEDANPDWVKDVGCFALSKFDFYPDLVAYLTRGPGKYGAEDIMLSVFRKKDNVFLARVDIAGSWSDEGVSNKWDTWVVDVNRDGYYDLLTRYVHPDCPMDEEPTDLKPCELEIRYTSYVWNGRNFNEQNLPNMNELLKKFWPQLSDL